MSRRQLSVLVKTILFGSSRRKSMAGRSLKEEVVVKVEGEEE
jgi:hypothetical protein